MADLAVTSLKLIHEGVRRLIDAAVSQATAVGLPVAIAIAGDGACIAGYLLIDSARLLAQESVPANATTVVSQRNSSAKRRRAC